MIDAILALNRLEDHTAGFLIAEIFSHGSLDTRLAAIQAFNEGIDSRWATKTLLEWLR